MEESNRPIKILTTCSDTICGPEDNWVIDPEGNCFLAGRLCVEGWVDPAFLLLTNQTASGGISDNSLVNFNEDVSYKDNGSVINTITPDLPRPKCRATRIDTSTTIGSADTTIISLTITPSSASVRILAQAAWTGQTTSGDKRTPTIKLMSSTTTLATYTQGTGPGGTRTQPFGGAIGVFDTVSGTAQRTYLLKMNTSALTGGTWVVKNASLSLIEVEVDA